MWDGRAETRAQSMCPYCDTDFFSHTMETSESILHRLAQLRSPGSEWVWVSGGEPALQLDTQLLDGLHRDGYRVAVETNGTIAFRPGVAELLDHLTMSPKRPFEETVVRRVNTLKILWPHPNPRIRPERFAGIEAQFRFLQPIEVNGQPSATKANLDSAIDHLNQLRGWRLSVQLHKLIGVD